MGEIPVVIFGAGATKACEGPLTNEILPEAFRDGVRQTLVRKDYLNCLEQFLTENFHLPLPSLREDNDYPSLPLLMSLLDTAIDRKQPFGAGWEPDRMAEVRAALEYTIFALLQFKLEKIGGGETIYYRFLRQLWQESQQPPAILTLNYDVLVDNELYLLSQEALQRFTFPEYGCDIQTAHYRQRPERFGTLLKLHGSLHWMCCPACHRLDIGYSRRGSRFLKLVDELFHETDELEHRFTPFGVQCRDTAALCQGHVRPSLITPTSRKDYRNPHIARIWYEADRMLRRANRVFFIGYGLPDDDIEVIYLLKRGLAHLSPQQITVVDYDVQQRSLKEHPVGLRYRSLFGDQIDWRTKGFQDYASFLHL